MKRSIPILLIIIAVLGARAVAQPTPVPGLQRVNHDTSMTGSGTIPGPLGVRVVAGGGITTNGGTTGVQLGACPSGQVWQSVGATWACADNASTVAGTLHKLACFTPDGSHVGNCNATDDGTTLTLGTTIALTEATGLITISNIGTLSTSNLVNINATNVSEGVAMVNTLTGATWGASALAGRISGTVDTTGSGGLGFVAGSFTVNATRIAGTDAQNNYGVMSTASGGASLNISYYAAASGTGAYSFYGSSGTFNQNDTGTFQSTLFADSTHRVIDQTASSARIVQTGPSIDLATIGTAGTCTNCTVTHDAWGRETSWSSGTAPVTVVNVTAPITTTGGATPTIGISEGNGITNSGGAIVVNNGTGLVFSGGALTYDNTVIQSRVSGTCTAPQAIASVSATGTVTCTTTITGGSGTQNRVVKWNNAGGTTIGNSSITDDGSVVTLTENVNGTTANFTSGTTAATFTAYANGTNRTTNVNALDNENFASYDTSAAARTGYGLQAWSYGTKGVAGHTLTNIAILANAFNGDVNLDFFGATGKFLQTDIAEFQAAVTADTTLKIGAGGDAAGAASTATLATNAGTTCSEVRDSTNHVEAEACASSSGAFFGAFTNNNAFIQTNATNAIKIDTSQNVFALKTLTVGPGSDAATVASAAAIVENNGTTSFAVRDATNDVEVAITASNLTPVIGTSTNHALNISTNGTAAISIDTSQNSTFIGHIIGGSTGVSVAAGGGCGTSPSVAGNDNFGKITVGGSTSTCVLTFAHAYASHEPACHATSTSANSNISISAAAAGSVTFSQSSPSMSGTTFYYVCGGY